MLSSTSCLVIFAAAEIRVRHHGNSTCDQRSQLQDSIEHLGGLSLGFGSLLFVAQTNHIAKLLGSIPHGFQAKSQLFFRCSFNDNI